jgi:hypothetical protein
MALIGTRAFSSGDASRKNSKAELQKRMDYNGLPGKLKFDAIGPVRSLWFFLLRE